MSRAGFTLVELVLVAALMVVVASIALPGFSRLVRTELAVAAANDTAAVIRWIAKRAVQTGTPHRILVESAAPTLRVSMWERQPRKAGKWVAVAMPSVAKPVPANVNVLVAPGLGPQAPATGVAVVVVGPDLSNEGLRLVFQSQKATCRVTMQPVTARVVVSPPLGRGVR